MILLRIKLKIYKIFNEWKKVVNKLYIVRHGKTDQNVKGIVQSSNDIELNEEGIKEAKELSKSINIDEIDSCIYSPLKRAKQTAETLVGDKIKIIYDDLLFERGFGDYEGKPINPDLIALHWDYNLNHSSHNLESIQNCLLRAKRFLEKI